MFFKKKKPMTENINDNMNAKSDITDNMAQNETDELVNGEEMNEDTDMQVEADQVSKLQAEVSEMKDKHLRLIAEFENLRRRNAKEKEELFKTAGKDILQSLLVVLDDMGRAEKQIESAKDIAAIREGVALVFGKLKSTLQSKGLKMMETGNDEFNPDLHEAITEIPAPSDDLKGKILDVVEPGYYLNDKLIRYAKVVVGN